LLEFVYAAADRTGDTKVSFTVDSHGRLCESGARSGCQCSQSSYIANGFVE
jgi:hypothetical protein